VNRIGSLCTGTGALDMAVERVLGGEMVWYSEFEKHPSTLLEARFPGIPNLGDLTKIDWASLPEIDILTGGYPCQPFSVAGKQLGEKDPRHIWPNIREAIRILRPRITLLENVAGHRRLGFDRVLGDCAEDGLDVQWVSVRASDVGAPHQRERLFFVVTDPSRSDVREHTGGSSAEEAGSHSGDGPEDHHGIRPSQVRWETASDAERLGCERGSAAPGQTEGPQSAVDGLCSVNWGDYEPAIRRWEHVLGRPAPTPTEPNKNGRPRLAAAFDEWMMGLPAGWITDIDIPYGAQIKLCGNGVVPQQAELALRLLLDMER
jgi:DNA (cytosine-5)-methyltransferase 1